MKFIKGNRSAWVSITLTLTLLASFFKFFSGSFSNEDGHWAFNDPFHQGEYFAVGKSLADSTLSAPALSIHGALDFLPDLLASRIFDNEHQFLLTYLLYALLGLLAVMLLLAINVRLMSMAKQQWTVLGLALMGVATVGYRDLFLLASLLTFYGLLTIKLSPIKLVILQILFGILLALGQHWSFDRGIAATLSLGVAALFLAWKEKHYLIALLSYALTMWGLNSLYEVFSFKALFENILFLTSTSSQWRYGANFYSVTLTVFAWSANLLALAAFWHSHLAAGTIKKNGGEAIALTVLAMLFIKVGTNRADLQHIYYALWVPGLLALRMNRQAPLTQSALIWAALAVYVLGVLVGAKFGSYFILLIATCLLYELTPSHPSRLQRFATIAMGGALIIAPLLVVASGYKNIRDDKYSWIQQLPVSQSNWQTAQPALQWVASELLRTRSACVFDLVNNGIINGLTKLPGCSRFTYPVYASVDYEDELIESLQQANPPAIVYSSNFWSYSIDGRSMKDRFPKLDEFILKMYPTQKCNKGYCLRYQTGI